MMAETSSSWYQHQKETPENHQQVGNDSGYLSHSGGSLAVDDDHCLRLYTGAAGSDSFTPFSHRCYEPNISESEEQSEGENHEELPLYKNVKLSESFEETVEQNTASVSDNCGLTTFCPNRKLLAAFVGNNKYQKQVISNQSEKNDLFSLETGILPTELHSSEDNSSGSSTNSQLADLFSKCDSEVLEQPKLQVRNVLPCSLRRRRYVDFLNELSSCQPAIACIFQYLEPKDLVSAASVSRVWREVCLRDSNANRRRLQFLQARVQTKENRNQALPFAQLQQHSRKYLRNGACSQLQNLRVSPPRKREPSSPPVSPSKIRFHLFCKEGGKLGEGEHLMPCPHCSLPSHTNETGNRGRCSRPGCLFEFCTRCHCTVHEGRPCPGSLPLRRTRYRSKHGGVGSAASRRNLRKLLL